jgi:predicted ATP-binding protein involved in virulence
MSNWTAHQSTDRGTGEHRQAVLRMAWSAYRGWAKLARDMQSRTQGWNLAALLCVVAAAVFGAVASVAPNLWSTFAALAAALTSAVGVFLGRHIIGSWSEAKSMQARATAEGIRSECYRYAARAAVYYQLDDAGAAKALAARTAEIAKDATDKGLVRANDPVPASGDRRAPPVPLTTDWYKKNRILDQIAYYQQARKKNQRAAKERWWVFFAACLAAVGLGAFGLVAQRFAPWIGAMTTIAALIAVYSLIDRRKYLIGSYAAMESNLEGVIRLDADAPMNIVDLVTTTENLFEVEYKALLPQMVAAPQPQPAPPDSVQRDQPSIDRPALNIALSFAAEDHIIAEALRDAVETINFGHNNCTFISSDSKHPSTLTSILDNSDILIQIITVTNTTFSFAGIAVGYFLNVIRTTPKMKNFPNEDRRVIPFIVLASTQAVGSKSENIIEFFDIFSGLQIDFDTAVSSASLDFEERNKRNIDTIVSFLLSLPHIFDRDETASARLSRRLALDLCRGLFVVIQSRQTESYREVERVKEERALTEERYLERNLKDLFVVQAFSWLGLSFVEDGQYVLSPRINVILGKNGYGKTLFMRTLVALLQRDAEHSSVIMKGANPDPSTRLNIHLTRNGILETISRDTTYFLDGIGKIPVLAIPDSRFIDRTKLFVSGTTSMSESLERSGALNFLTQKPYENVIQDFLTLLSLDYVDTSSSNVARRFDRPIFRLVESIVAELTEDRDFRFADVRRVDTTRFQILVHTAGAIQDPIPIQLASQGTLSIVAIFGLIYSFLRSLHRNVKEEDLCRTTGLVLIDEIDAHLHPSWQQKILQLLTSRFPKVQFVVSAHSPLIVAGCDRGEVSVLRRREGAGRFYLDPSPTDFLGAKAADLYQRVFDIEETDRLYLEYSAKTPKDLESSKLAIARLQGAENLSAEQQHMLSTFRREQRLITRAEEVRAERLEAVTAEARLRKVEAQLDRVRYELMERDCKIEHLQEELAALKKKDSELPGESGYA